jgi:pimeloyl-ACP methyl ester carboxylesterase
MSVQREKIRFPSGDVECAAWHYPGTNGGCVVMAAGTAVTMEPGTDAFAARFAAAGFAVLAFDFRRLGDSDGQPRQVVRIADQLDDWAAAIDCARALPGVDPARVGIWGFSLAGGQLLDVAARDDRVAAVVAQSPMADGRAVTGNALRHQRPLALLRFTARGILDGLGSAVGRPPRLVPLAGEPGTVAVLTTPDSLDGEAALNPGNRYPEWRQVVAAWSALRIGSYRPVRRAARVRCPLLVVACDDDRSVLAAPAVRVAERAPAAELVRLPGGHYAPFLAAHEAAVEAELSFLRRHLLGAERGMLTGPGAAAC